jgi:hypothetical protein
MVWMRPNAVTFLSRLVLFIIVSPGFVAARTVVHVGSQLSGILGTIGQEGGEVHNVRNGLDQFFSILPQARSGICAKARKTS